MLGVFRQPAAQLFARLGHVPRRGNKWCAALNRGMLDAPDSTDATKYYGKAPYNVYSKWVHDTCPGIYAFAYDDYPSGAGQSGYRSCTADRLDVTFCPGG